jgi:hypothetical protein
MKTSYQMLLIRRFTKVTNDPIVHGAGVLNVARAGGDEETVGIA